MASITDYARMCKAHDDECGVAYCPISYKYNGYDCSCTYLLRHHPAEASAIIDKWCAEHPQKTYWQDFKEKFPKAEHYVGCRAAIYEGSEACTNREKSCCACWYEVMPEETGNE